MKSIVFIHRSVGQNLINDGNLRKLLSGHSFDFTDYNQNTDILTKNKGEVQKCEFQFPLNDTKPASYSQIFRANPEKDFKPIRDFALEYDLIIIKSCYTNNKIANDHELESLNNSYRSIVKFFNMNLHKEFIILTSPPLAPIITTEKNALYARSLASWLSSEELGKNVSVFNFYDLLADPETNYLKKQYRRFLPFDSHPNKKASLEIAPKLSELIISKFPETPLVVQSEIVTQTTHPLIA